MAVPGPCSLPSKRSHVAGETLSSASGGLQEALIAARYAPTNPPGTPQSGVVVVPPKELKAFARVSIRSSNLTVDFSGSILECWMDDACIFVGDPSNANAYQDITLINPRGRPTIAHGQKPFIEVNAQKTRLFNVSTRVPLKGGSFGSYVQVDDDESFLLDGLDTSLRQRRRALRRRRLRSRDLRAGILPYFPRRGLAEEPEYLPAVRRQRN